MPIKNKNTHTGYRSGVFLCRCVNRLKTTSCHVGKASNLTWRRWSAGLTLTGAFYRQPPPRPKTIACSLPYFKSHSTATTTMRTGNVVAHHLAQLRGTSASISHAVAMAIVGLRCRMWKQRYSWQYCELLGGELPAACDFCLCPNVGTRGTTIRRSRVSNTQPQRMSQRCRVVLEVE